MPCLTKQVHAYLKKQLRSSEKKKIPKTKRHSIRVQVLLRTKVHVPMNRLIILKSPSPYMESPVSLVLSQKPNHYL